MQVVCLVRQVGGWLVISQLVRQVAGQCFRWVLGQLVRLIVRWLVKQLLVRWLVRCQLGSYSCQLSSGALGSQLLVWLLFRYLVGQLVRWLVLQQSVIGKLLDRQQLSVSRPQQCNFKYNNFTSTIAYLHIRYFSFQLIFIQFNSIQFYCSQHNST